MNDELVIPSEGIPGLRPTAVGEDAVITAMAETDVAPALAGDPLDESRRLKPAPRQSR